MTEKIKITFLGTGSSIPTAKKNHPATLLSYKAENILFDCGEGTQRQFRKAKLNPCKITKIFLTHWHGDHILGLPGLLQTLNLNGYIGELIIYGPKGSKNDFKNLIAPYLGFYWNITKETGNKFNIVMKEIDEGKVLDEEDFFIEAIRVDHGCPALAYSFNIKEKSRIDKEKLSKLKIPNGPLIGELAKGKTISFNGKKIDGKKLIYTEKARKISLIMDTAYSERLADFAKDSNLLICESSYSRDEEEIAKEHKHLTSVEAAKIAKKSKSKKLFLTHLSQRYEAIPKKILEEAKEFFKDVEVAEDLKSLEI